MLLLRSCNRLKVGIMGSVLMALVGSPVAGQDSPQPPSAPQALSRTVFGIGVVGNLPDAGAGVSAYVLFPSLGGIGIYVDGKLDFDNPTGQTGFESGMTSSDVYGEGGTYRNSDVRWWSVNAAVVRPVSPFLMIYGGAGYAHKKVYDLFNIDPESGVGVGGVVWAESPDGESTHPNLMIGVMMRLSSRINTQFGFETQPRGLTAGASLKLPGW